MLTDELDYELPTELIAQEPIEPRDAARLLVDRGEGHPPSDSTVARLSEWIEPGDLVVLNETRVLPARVGIRRASGASGELLLLNPSTQASAGAWEALCRPSRKLKDGETVTAVNGRLEFLLEKDLGAGRWAVVPSVDGGIVAGERLEAALEVSGVMPLPPYIDHDLIDRERYQTIYSRRPASAAAPTAGLHFTDAVFRSLRDKGAQICTVELVVGLDTFRPITDAVVENHQIHTEWYTVPDETWDAVERAKASKGRVVAVGTTSVRALESRAATGNSSGRTDLFIFPGYEFAVVDLMLTNFHLPRTSLLAMIEAFVGSRWRELYSTAVDRRYRFLSFGDAMLLERRMSPSANVERTTPT